MIKKVREALARYLYNLYCTIFGERAVSVGNVRIICAKNDFSAGLNLWLGKEYEPNLIDVLRDNLEKGDIFVDVGANIGLISCIAAKIVGEGGKVLAFEPHHGFLSILKRNILLNGIDNTVVYDLALDDSAGIRKFYRDRTRPSTSALSDSGDCYVQCVPGDSVIGRADFIKIDVEGAEYRVLTGMGRLLSGRVKLLVEAHEPNLKNFGHSLSDLRRFLELRGFSIREIDDGIMNWYCEKHD